MAYNNFKHLNSDNGIAGKYFKQSILPTNGTDFLSLYELNTARGDHQQPLTSEAEAGIHASDHQGNVTGPEEFSQDNLIGLMIGLVTIIKAIPSDISIRDPQDCIEYYLTENAKNILSRIIYYMEDSYDKYYGNNSDDPHYHDNKCIYKCYTLTNPITGMCVKGVDWSHFFNYGINNDETYCQICWAGGAIGYWYSGCYKQVYHYWVDKPNEPSSCDGLIHFAPFPNEWGPMDATLFTLIDKKITNEINTVRIENYFTPVRKIEFKFLDLLYCFLWGGDPLRALNFYDNFLYNYSCGTDWTNENYFNHSEENLLPQMLVHNLLKIEKGHTYNFPQPEIINISDVNPYYPHEELINNLQTQIHGTNFFDTVICPKLYTPAVYISYGTLNSTSTISKYTFGACTWSGWVQYKAVKKIVLKQGFKVTDGAYFNEKICPQCEVKTGGDYGWLQYCVYGVQRSFSDTVVNNADSLSDSMSVKIMVYPNPTDGIFTVLCTDADLSFSVELKNVIGKSIFIHNNIINQKLFDLTSFPKGIYIVKVIISGTEVLIKKIIYR